METPMVAFAEGTATNDRHGRNAQQVQAVTMLSGQALSSDLDVTFQAKNFDLNGGSLTVPEAVSDIQRTHQSHQRLVTAIQAAAATTQASVVSTSRTLSDALSYNDLLSSLLCEGEKLECGFMLEFAAITMQARKSVTDDYVNIDRTLRNGRLALTNGRLIAMSSEPSVVGTVTRHGVRNSKTNSIAKETLSYEVQYETSDNIHFRPYPLEEIKSFDFHLSMATQSAVQITGPTRCCCCCSCGKKWHSALRPPTATTVRQIILYLTNGPFENTPGVALSIEVSAMENIEKVKQFLVEIQKAAPNIGVSSISSLSFNQPQMNR